MIGDILQLRNKLQPKSDSNSDNLQFDYKFWTELESLAKKNRDTSLDAVKGLSDKPDKPGVIVMGKLFHTTLTESKPVLAFDKEEFVKLLNEKYPEIEKHKIRELILMATIPGNTRKSYRTEPND